MNKAEMGTETMTEDWFRDRVDAVATELVSRFPGLSAPAVRYARRAVQAAMAYAYGSQGENGYPPAGPTSRERHFFHAIVHNGAMVHAPGASELLTTVILNSRPTVVEITGTYMRAMADGNDPNTTVSATYAIPDHVVQEVVACIAATI